jgi:hypothetical protein
LRKGSAFDFSAAMDKLDDLDLNPADWNASAAEIANKKQRTLNMFRVLIVRVKDMLQYESVAISC